MSDITIPTRSLRPKADFVGESALIVCIHAPDEERLVGTSWRLGQYLAFGRGLQTPSVGVSSPDVSAKHCKIERTSENTYLLSDQGSANGIFVDKERVESVYLSHRRTFDLAGQYKFMFWLGRENDPELVSLIKSLVSL